MRLGGIRKALLPLGQICRLLRQLCCSIRLIFENFRPGLRILLNLLLQLSLQLFLRSLELRISFGFSPLLLLIIFSLTRNFVFTLSEFIQSRQLLKASLVFLNLFTNLLQLLDSILGSLLGFCQLFSTSFRSVLQGSLLETLTGFRDFLGSLPHIFRTSSLNSILHSFSELFQLLLSVREFVPCLSELFLRLFRKLLFLYILLVPLHAIFCLSGLPDSFVNGLTHIALLRSDLLPGQRFRIPVNLNDKPLRPADVGSSQGLRQVISYQHRHSDLFEIVIFFRQFPERDRLLPYP